MRLVTLALACMALSACVSAPPPTISAPPVAARGVAVGTLSGWSEWEDQTAPVMTRIGMLAKQAEIDARAGRIGKDRALIVSRLLTKAAEAAGLAVRGDKLPPTAANLAALTEARRLANLAAAAMEND